MAQNHKGDFSDFREAVDRESIKYGCVYDYMGFMNSRKAREEKIRKQWARNLHMVKKGVDEAGHVFELAMERSGYTLSGISAVAQLMGPKAAIDLLISGQNTVAHHQSDLVFVSHCRGVRVSSHEYATRFSHYEVARALKFYHSSGR